MRNVRKASRVKPGYMSTMPRHVTAVGRQVIRVSSIPCVTGMCDSSHRCLSSSVGAYLGVTEMQKSCV